MKTNKELFLNIIGFIFLLFGIVAVLNSFYIHNPNQIFWNCYIGCLLFGIGVLRRNGALIGAQICILAIPVIIWNVDFIFRLITGDILFGFTSYMFSEGFNIGKIVSLQHLFVLPLGIFALSKIKTAHFNFWKIALVQAFLMFIPVYFLTDHLDNINCVFASCIPLNLGLGQFATWFLGYFIIIAITNFILFLVDKKSKIFRE